ncbi:hypothetical protein C5Y96_12245 [Blastopirellula marina]|uniref:Uncharacterized protein n=1 Tax=Blastopirellula marina TaxID=124 RepID=A0A2S8FG35_9BACT|nr:MULTISPECIES: hypothetical protein [Pirellulaceae]PQO31121.1 hypothetical protein C5Y96_12245 [Blastopirellula marina]RCS51515.1 hypothetical protein DTL36_12255 [Bremerella cremea]
MLSTFRVPAFLFLCTGLLIPAIMPATVDAQDFPRREERERDEFRREQERVNQSRPRIDERMRELEQQRHEQMEREHHRMMLEGHRLDFEMHKLHLERISAQAHIANDAVLSAAFALERLPELIPNVKERREVLEDFLEASQNIAVQRLIRMKLLELPAEGRDREEALEILGGLIP